MRTDSVEHLHGFEFLLVGGWQHVVWKDDIVKYFGERVEQKHQQIISIQREKTVDIDIFRQGLLLLCLLLFDQLQQITTDEVDIGQIFFVLLKCTHVVFGNHMPYQFGSLLIAYFRVGLGPIQ